MSSGLECLICQVSDATSAASGALRVVCQREGCTAYRPAILKVGGVSDNIMFIAVVSVHAI